MKLDTDGQIVVLLVNLGTPNQPKTREVRTYLREFLSDKDVIRLPRIFWLPLLHLIILRVRPKKSAALYRKVWTEWGSPLLYNSFLQAGKLRKIFAKNKEPNFIIDVAMRYGKPSIESKLVEYNSKGYKKIFKKLIYISFLALLYFFSGCVFYVYHNLERNRLVPFYLR